MASLRLILPLTALVAAGAACGDNIGPGGRLVAKTTQLVQYNTCSALETDLEDQLIRETHAAIDRSQDWGGDVDGGDGADPASGEDSGGPREEGVDYSGTNNQEEGVDEADFVKTDGFHIYSINGNRLHIFGVPEFGQLVPTSVTEVEGHPRELLLDKDSNRAVVFSMIDVGSLPEGHPLRALVGFPTEDESGYGWYWRSRLISKVTVLDITNRAAPALVREAYFEGYYQTARKVDTSVRVSSYATIDRPELWDWWQDLEELGAEATKARVSERIRGLALADLIPQVYIRTAAGQFTTTSLSTDSCRSFYRPTDSHARGIASILSFDLAAPTFELDADHVIANNAVFYSSQDNIILAEEAHSWWWYWWYPGDPDQLNIHAFDIRTPGESRYAGSGRVEGYLSNQFAIDEEDGAIRLATTTGLQWRWWRGDEETPPPEPESHVWVLEQAGSQLVPVGHVGGIAPGERIMSSRFVGDRGYLVTFRQVDPLFTLDLSDNANPRVVGELKIPGFSTYIHPIADNKLLTIGVGGDENGANWRTTVSTFDVSNFAAPTQSASVAIDAEDGWGWSEALYEHKAFSYWAPKGLLAVPQSSSSYDYEGDGGYTWRYLSKLELVKVIPETGALTRYGSIDHTAYYNQDPQDYWSYVDIRRSIFMGDFIYAISDKAISVHRTDTLVKTTDALLPGYTANDYYWWW